MSAYNVAMAVAAEHRQRTGHDAYRVPFEPHQVDCDVCSYLRPVLKEYEQIIAAGEWRDVGQSEQEGHHE